MKLNVCDGEVDRQQELQRNLIASVDARAALLHAAPEVVKTVRAVRVPALPIDEIVNSMTEQRRRIRNERWAAGIRHMLGRIGRSALQLRNDVRDFFRGK